MDTASTHRFRAGRRTAVGRAWVVIRSFGLAILLACVVSSPSLTSAHTPDNDQPNPGRWL